MKPSDLRTAIAFFDKSNRLGADVLLESGENRYELGLADSFLVLRSNKDAFWVLFKQKGFHEGQQFAHTHKIVRVEALPEALRLTDSTGRRLTLGAPDSPEEWVEWQHFKAANNGLEASAEMLLREHSAIAHDWKDDDSHADITTLQRLSREFYAHLDAGTLTYAAWADIMRQVLREPGEESAAEAFLGPIAPEWLERYHRENRKR
jgi:hypothetical protein